MSFYNQYKVLRERDVSLDAGSTTDTDVLRALAKSRLGPEDFFHLLSPAAEAHLERMAERAHALTLSQFGRTIVLFTPMYLSNFCTNSCLYCGFNQSNRIERRQLTLDEVEKEAKEISATGIKHILILTGDAPTIATVDYIAACCRVLKRHFSAIGIEIYALSQLEYGQLIASGVDSLTIYQETYNEALYAKLHPKGPKKDYRFRLQAPERACQAGMRAINVGALLGLDDWRRDAFFTGLHANYLQDRYPETETSISLPRMRPHVGDFQPNSIAEDRHIVQIMTAMRLFMPRVGITISTRENAWFRDRLLPLGVTRMSAGSCTAVGGRSDRESTVQFDISDERSVSEMVSMLRQSGWQPVYQDWRGIDGEGDGRTAQDHG